MAQTKSEPPSEKLESPYDVMNLKFVLAGSPSPEDVGFANPHSFWQFTYKLQFLADPTILDKFIVNISELREEETLAEQKNEPQIERTLKKLGKKIV